VSTDWTLNTFVHMSCDSYVGKEVEIYLDVCLKTPGLPKEDVKKALLVRRLAGERLQCHPSDGQVRPSELPIREVDSTRHNHYCELISL
jgi:hypothetical protein